VGFVVELDDEFYCKGVKVAEDEVNGFAVDFVLVGLTFGDAGSFRRGKSITRSE